MEQSNFIGLPQKKEVFEKIDLAATVFHNCWDTLNSVKAGTKPLDYQQVMDFQPHLAQAIYDLDRCYDAICQQERDLISKKSQFDHTQFATQMAELANLRKAIDKTLHIGKIIGDSFAWIFYLRNREILTNQVTKPRTMHTPSGLGGLGELTFVRSVPRFKHYLPLYHGITTLLRSGDFTLIDLRTFKIAALVELKTSRIDINTLSFSLHTISQQDSTDLTDGFSFPPTRTDMTEKPPVENVNNVNGFNQRLERQVKTMVSVLKESTPNKYQECHNAYHIEELRDLIRNLDTSTHAYKQVGPGLLLMAANIPQASLSERVFNYGKHVDVHSIFPDLTKAAQKIVLPGSNHNRIIISELNGSLPSGATPMFWWPVEISFLKKILFGEIWIGTIFNPAHLAEKLVGKGFIISGEGRPERWTIQKLIGEYKASLHGFHYFISAIQSHLMREDAVIDVIEKTTTEAASQKPGTHVNMLINHNMM